MSEPGQNLELVPEELVVDLVVELDFRGLDVSPEQPWAAVRGRLFEVGETRLYVLAQQLGGPCRVAEVLHRRIDVVRQVALGLTEVGDLRGLAIESRLEERV